LADAHTTREQRRGIAGRWGEALRAPIDIASLVYFRVIFGAIMVWEVWRYFDHGWIRAYWIDPVFHFTYAGFRWLEPWPGDWMFFHMLALGVLAAFIMVGFLYRLSTALFFLGFSYIFLLEKARYLNHFYFIILIAFLLMFLPAHRAFSVDACIWPRIKARMVPAWTLWSLRAQLGIVYFFGGVAKLNADWLRGEPVGIWLSGAYYYLHEQTLVGSGSSLGCPWGPRPFSSVPTGRGRPAAGCSKARKRRPRASRPGCRAAAGRDPSWP
jgi:hypothetical protein